MSTRMATLLPWATMTTPLLATYHQHFEHHHNPRMSWLARLRMQTRPCDVGFAMLDCVMLWLVTTLNFERRQSSRMSPLISGDEMCISASVRFIRSLLGSETPSKQMQVELRGEFDYIATSREFDMSFRYATRSMANSVGCGHPRLAYEMLP